MSVYYNEIDPFAAQWLRHLIVVGHIAAGDVDERDIKDVKPEDIKGYTQCHFFAGIGAWSYALRLAGWPDDKPVWTGSCPCQPFSCAGKGKAFDDERHLWPEWYRLIRECRPAIIFGEQVDAAVRWGWLDLVQSDLEAAGYACGTAVIPAAGIGAPHIRHRLWVVGKNTLVNAQDNRRVQRSVGDETEEKCPSCSGREEKGSGRNDQPNDGESGKLADSADIGQHRRRTSEASDGRDETREQPAGSHTTCGVGNTQCDGHDRQEAGSPVTGSSGQDSILPVGGDFMAEGQPAGLPVNGFWANADWLFCRDGKWRPVKPGLEPLVNRPAARMGRLRAYGNAIVPQVAATFIRACM